MLWPNLRPKRAAHLCHELASVANSSGADTDVLHHLVRLYGTDAKEILADGQRHGDLLRRIDDAVPTTFAELRYLCRHEQVRHLLDLVKRRTALYFVLDRCGMDAMGQIARAAAGMLGWSRKCVEDEIGSVAAEAAADCAALSAPSVPDARQLVAQTISA